MSLGGAPGAAPVARGAEVPFRCHPKPGASGAIVAAAACACALCAAVVCSANAFTPEPANARKSGQGRLNPANSYPRAAALPRQGTAFA